MALKDILNTIKTKAENIFYEQGDMPVQDARAYRDSGMQQSAPANDPYAAPYGEQHYDPAAYQPQQPAYAPQQNAYQQPQQQMDYTQQQGMWAQQQPMYQQAQQQPYQPQQAYQPQQNMYAQPPVQEPKAPQGDDNKVVYFPNSQAAPAQENAPTACVINARNVSECYSAIVQLRLGNMVVVVLENILDATEMRHYVDMLSGACYALKGTITKLSRHGAYLICPNHVKVCVDAATNQFNSPSNRAQRPMQPPFQGQMQPQQPMQQQASYAQGGMNYQRRPQQADPEQMPLYSRPVAPDPNMVMQNQRQAFNGYVPDMPMENAQ